MAGKERKPAKQPKAPSNARQSGFTQDKANAICERLATGESLESICRDDGMPSAPTVRRWVLNNVEGFAAVSARAYSLGYEALAEQCLLIADTPQEGVEVTTKANGDTEEKRGDMLGHRRLQIDTRMRLLGKWAPKRYGERLTQEVTGANGGPVLVANAAELTDDQLAAIAAGHAQR